MLFGKISCNVQTPPFRSRAAIFTMRSGIEAYPNDTLFQVSLCNAYGSAASSIITASSLQTCRISQKCRFWLKIGSTLYTIMANNFQWCLTMFIGPISMPLDIRKSISVQVLKRWVKKCATRRETSSECVALRIAFGILRAWQNCIAQATSRSAYVACSDAFRRGGAIGAGLGRATVFDPSRHRMILCRSSHKMHGPTP